MKNKPDLSNFQRSNISKDPTEFLELVQNLFLGRYSPDEKILSQRH